MSKVKNIETDNLGRPIETTTKKTGMGIKASRTISNIVVYTILALITVIWF